MQVTRVHGEQWGTPLCHGGAQETCDMVPHSQAHLGGYAGSQADAVQEGQVSAVGVR